MSRQPGRSLTDWWANFSTATRIGRELGTLTGLVFQRRILQVILQLLLDMCPIVAGSAGLIWSGRRLFTEEFASGGCAQECIRASEGACCLFSAASLTFLTGLQVVLGIAGFFAALRAPRGQALQRSSLMTSGVLIALTIFVLFYGMSVVMAVITAAGSLISSFIGYRLALRLKRSRKPAVGQPAHSEARSLRGKRETPSN